MRSPWTWVIVLGIAVVGGGYLLWRRSQTPATTTPTTGTPAGTPSPDWSGEIATLQTEIMDLQSSTTQAQAADKTEDKNEDKNDDDDDHKPPKKNTVTVPHVVGEAQATAIDDLADAGLRGVGQRPVRGTIRYVTAQSPKAGAKVAKGSTVRLTTKFKPPADPDPDDRRPRRRRPVPKTHHHHVTRRKAAV